jgi:autophagy-related protein 2
LYDGYDWARTRRIIEEEAKEMRRRLAKIRQLVADGQTPDPTVEETNTLLFNSVYIGLEHNVDELEPGALIAAIDEELNDLETASQSSWQSLKPQPTSPKTPEKPLKRSKKAMARSAGPSIEFRLEGLSAEVDNYRSHESLASRILVAIRDAEILDHIKTSTWSKFLTSLHTDSRGNIRETGSNMVRVELRKVYPVPGNPAQEARLKVSFVD